MPLVNSILNYVLPALKGSILINSYSQLIKTVYQSCATPSKPPKTPTSWSPMFGPPWVKKKNKKSVKPNSPATNSMTNYYQ